MKKLLFGMLILQSVFAYAMGVQKVAGTITLSKNLEKKLTPSGALFVFAKKAGANAQAANGMPPMAVLKITNPKFPQAFELSASNVMIAGTKFEGPMKVMAQYSPNGDAISSPESLEGDDVKNPSIPVGKLDIKIDLKAKKK